MGLFSLAFGLCHLELRVRSARYLKYMYFTLTLNVFIYSNESKTMCLYIETFIIYLFERVCFANLIKPSPT